MKSKKKVFCIKKNRKPIKCTFKDFFNYISCVSSCIKLIVITYWIVLDKISRHTDFKENFKNREQGMGVIFSKRVIQVWNGTESASRVHKGVLLIAKFCFSYEVNLRKLNDTYYSLNNKTTCSFQMISEEAKVD